MSRPFEIATVPLGFTDSHGGFDQSATTVIYLLKLSENAALSPSDIEAAATRVADKWRLFAGRVIFDKQVNAFTIETPIGDIPNNYTTLNFTAVTHTTPFPTPLAPVSPSTCAFIAPLHLASLRAPTTEGNLLAIADKDIPIVSIHVVTYTDYQQISFTISHSIVDATAFNVYLRAFSDELNGIEWEAPPLEGESELDKAVARILSDSDVPKEEYEQLAIGPGGPLEGGHAKHWSQPFTLLGAIAYEKMWHGVEDGGAFLGKEVVDWLVEKVKREVQEQSGGREFVSTGDVLQAWLLKSAYADEPRAVQPRIGNALCLRKVLGLEGRPQHTVLTYFNLHGPSPHHSTLAQLALTNRRRLTAVKSSPLAYAATYSWLKEQNHPIPLYVPFGFESWLFSDQRQTGRPQAIDWATGTGNGRGGKQWFWIKEKTDTKDNCMSLNKLEDGYTWTGVMRRARWASVRRALVALEAEFAGSK